MKTIETLDISPFKRLVMTIGELPTSFIESMSYYEALAWLVDYIEKTVIPVVNNNAEVTKEVQTAFQTLKDYVDHYFENLDVQEEINNKLDDMAESGELVEVISAYLNAKSVLAFDTVASMAEAENLIDGCFVCTYGYEALADGKGHLYKIRTREESDDPDGYNLVAVGDSLVAEIVNLDWGTVFGFDTVADLENCTYLFDGSFVSTYGKDNLGDGGGRLYKVRTRVQADDPDGDNLIAIGDSLVAEKISYDYMITMHNTSQLTFYVDASAGSDSNTGLTSEDPLQTIEEGFSRYINKGFVSIYVYIRSGYGYTIHHRNFTGLNIHIKNWSTSGNDTTITFDSDTNYIFYQTHLNITGDASNIIKLVMSYPNHEFYTDSGGFVMDYVNATNVRMRLWGGALNANHSQLAYVELQLSSGASINDCVLGHVRIVGSIANIYACTFKDQIATVDSRAYQVYFGDSLVTISGVTYVYTTNRIHSEFIEIYNSTFFLESTLNNEGGSAFSSSVYTNNSDIRTTLARKMALLGLASSNSIDYGVVFKMDTGWINATYADGFSSGLASASVLRYRRIDEVVYVKGSVSGWSAAGTDTPCATLPVHYRPSSRIDTYAGTNGQYFAGIRIAADGGICLMKDSGDTTTDRWYDINCSFIVASDI